MPQPQPSTGSAIPVRAIVQRWLGAFAILGRPEDVAACEALLAIELPGDVV